MTALSDAAFKLFAWLSLKADRHTGQIRLPVAEVAQALGKCESEIQAASDELIERGVCRRGMDLELEIADRYWPYEKQSSQSGPQEYVVQIRKLLAEPACVRCRFTAADEEMARHLYQQGVSLVQVARAIWLGCARKYTTLLSNGAAPMPIASFSLHPAERHGARTGVGESPQPNGGSPRPPFRGWPTSAEWWPASPESDPERR